MLKQWGFPHKIIKKHIDQSINITCGYCPGNLRILITQHGKTAKGWHLNLVDVGQEERGKSSNGTITAENYLVVYSLQHFNMLLTRNSISKYRQSQHLYTNEVCNVSP